MPERMLFRLPVRDLFQENKEFCPVTFHMQIPHSSSAELNK